MSAGQDFDPSLLEGKDRPELVAIATSLGQKPPARAKKADVIALIMELVGADASPAPGGSGSDVDASTGPDTSNDGEAEQGASEAAEPPAPDATAGQDATAGKDTTGNDADADVDDHRADEGNRLERSPNHGQEVNGNRADPAPQNQDEDGGNRRRRRRGRDRRPEGDEGAVVEPVEVEGMVELREEGYGFLRLNGFVPSREDPYVSIKQGRQFGLRTGDIVKGKARPANRNEKNPALLQVERVNGHGAHQQPSRRRFADLTPVVPAERLKLELKDDPANITARIIDLVAPVAKGTRGLIVSPPKSGKTEVVRHIVRSIEVNHPDVELIVLLLDERPEEVTEMNRWLLRGTVAASTFDRPADEHVAMSELVIERAKRLVEDGKDVVIVLDGLTRLARAHNAVAPQGGRVMPGGIDTAALHPPKRFFGAARRAEEGGSLTILATVSVETDSAMDEVIFRELEGTENMELKLDRRLAERRVHPAIDVVSSFARHEDRLFDRSQLEAVVELRRILGELRDESGSNAAGIAALVERLGAAKTNDDVLAAIAKA
jgi:transcription termination factor Rho